MMAGAATSQRMAAVPAMAPGAARLSFSDFRFRGVQKPLKKKSSLHGKDSESEMEEVQVQSRPFFFFVITSEPRVE